MEEKKFEPNEVKSVKIYIRGVEFDMSIEEAKALKISLENLLGKDYQYIPWVWPTTYQPNIVQPYWYYSTGPTCSPTT